MDSDPGHVPLRLAACSRVGIRPERTHHGGCDDQMFLRFIVDEVDQSSLASAGVFVVAYRLKRERALLETDHRHLLELLNWFDENLATPTRFNRSRRAHRASRGICWFRPSAQEHIRRARELARLIDRQGLWVNMMKTGQPGFVVFEDEHQIVAEPFAGRPAIVGRSLS